MTDTSAAALARALRPIISRVRTDITAIKLPDGSRWTDEALTPALLTEHVAGGRARGVCPMHAPASTTRVALLDFDSHKGETTWAEMCAVAEQVSGRLAAQGLFAIPWRSSGGRGIHLYLLWDQDQDAYSVRETLGEVLGSLGYKNGAKGVKNREIEVFPKQDEVLVGENGNQFILPLAGRSVPLDPLLGLDTLPREAVLTLDWPSSAPVPRRERPVRVQARPEDCEPIEKVIQALAAIPNDGVLNDYDYDQWFRLGCAVHEATAGSDEGLEAFLAWSRQNPRHDEKFTIERVWDYLKSSRSKAVTRASLFHAATSFGWGVVEEDRSADGFDEVSPEVLALQAKKPEPQVSNAALVDAKDAWKALIENAPDEPRIRDICARIMLDATLGVVERDMLAEAVKSALKELDSKVGIAACRKLITAPKAVKAKVSAESFAQGWVYSTHEDAFFRLDSDELVTMQGFNAKFNRFLPPAEDGAFRRNAGHVALEDFKIPTVTRRMYLPWAGPLFELDGTHCANLFRPSSMPEIADAFTPQGLKARNAVIRHINILTGGRKEVTEVLLSWMAYQVQHPGRKVRWAPLIKGVEGDGKSLIGRVMASVLGTPNVRDISPKVLGTDFSDWAHGACVGVLEEIKLTGHNRYDILNALKPYVTNNMVEIHPKGRAAYNVLNTMNYIAFTNHSDALPIGDTDRRWFIIFTPFSHISDLEKLVGDTGDYFGVLFDGIEQHRGELRKWLSEYLIADSFQPNGRAMLTAEKSSMVALNTSPESEAVSACIEAGGVGISQNVLCVRKLSLALQNMQLDAPLLTSALSRELVKLGWIKAAKRLKWQGEAHHVWVKGVSPTDQESQRNFLNRTLVTSQNVDEEYDLFA